MTQQEQAPLGKSLLRRGAELLGVRPDEAAALFAAAAFQFAFVAGVAILKASSNALLVGTKSLPVLYVASSLVTGFVAAWIAIVQPARKWPPTGIFAAWTVALIGLAAAVRLNVPYAVDALYLAAEVYATTISVRFWANVGDLFDVRESRRLLGLVGGVGMAGSIFGGFLTRSLGELTGPLRLVPAAAISLVICLLLAPRVRRASRRPATASSIRRATLTLPVTPREYLLRNGLPRTMAIVAALLSLLTAFSDFLFRARAKEIYTTAEQTALYGGLSAVIGVVAMVLQLGLTGTLLKRVGLFGYLTVTPVLSVLFAVTAVFVPGLWPVYALKAVEQVGALSLTQTGMQLLYGPMPDAVKSAARNAVDGFAKKFGYAVGGLLLIAAATLLDGAVLPWAVVIAGFATLFALFRVRKHYVRAVGERLHAGPDDDQDIALTSGTARTVLEEALATKDEGQVLTALELLSRDRAVKLDAAITTLLEHESPKVRARAAKLAGDRGVQAAAVRLTYLALNDASNVREASIESVAKLRPFTAARSLGPLLESKDLATRAAAISALVPLDPAGPAGKALSELLQPGAQAMPGERAQVARLLGRLGAGPYAKRLIAFLQDPTPMVRIAACEAAGESGDAALVGELLKLIVARETRAHARKALARFGDRIGDRIEELLNDEKAPHDLRYRLPRLLREIGTKRALEIILFSNPFDDPFLQYRLSVAAARIREKDPTIEVDENRVIEATGRRLDYYEELLPVYRDVEAALGPGNLLVRALSDRLDQYLESAVRLCSLLYPPRQVTNAFARFVYGDEKTRAYAIEMLEHVVSDGSLSRRLTHALERWHRRPDWNDEGNIARAAERLPKFVDTKDLVLRGIAIAMMRRLAKEHTAAVNDPTPAIDRGSGVRALVRIARGDAWDHFWANIPDLPEEGHMSEQVVEKILFLEGVDIFAESDVDDLAAVAQYLKERDYAEGEVIYHENDTGDALYVLVEGKVLIEKDRKRILELGPRDSFGETSLLDNKPRPATAKCVSPVKVLVLERADFMDLVSDRVELLRGIFGAITKHLRSVLDAAAAGRITSPGLTPVSMPRIRRGNTNPSLPPIDPPKSGS